MIRRIRVRVLILVSLLLLSACVTTSPQLPTAVTETPSAAPPATLPPGPSDQLRWSFGEVNDVLTLDPAKAGDSPSVTALGLIFNGLIRLNEHLEVQPDGAERWEVSTDGRVYTFTIREGLTFADGTPVTAEDFVFSLNRALAPATASFGASFHLGRIVGAEEVVEGRASGAEGIRAINARTLEIRLKEPQAHFLAQLSFPSAFVVPRALVESGPGWEERAFGTGPFRVAEWRHGEALVLRASEHYWRGRPGFSEIAIRFNQSADEAYAAYMAGELDIMGSQQSPIPAGLVSQLQHRPGLHSTASLTTRYVGFNNLLPPFDNLEVRRAFAMAVDKEQLSNSVLNGAVIPAHRMLPVGMLGTELPIRPLAFDPAAARRALESAGFGEGRELPPVTLTYEAGGDNELTAHALQRFWRDHLGVQVDLEPLELAAFTQRLDTTYFTPTAGLQLYISVWSADYPDPQNFISQQLRSDSPNNNGHFADEEFDRLTSRADQRGAPEDLDLRLQLYNQAEQIAIDKVGWLPLYYPRFITLIHPDITGMVVTPNGIVVPDWTRIRREAR